MLLLVNFLSTHQIRVKLPWTSPHRVPIPCKQPAFYHAFLFNQTEARIEAFKCDTFSSFNTFSLVGRTETSK